MYELDVIAVGKEKDADAIAARFTRPDNGAMAHVVIDAGWQADGEKVVGVLEQHYKAPSVDVLLLTHPDGDHIGGMGKILDAFSVDRLVLHRLDQRGGGSLPAADAVKELVEKAESKGTEVLEPRPGLTFAGGALTILGPSDEYYDQLVAEEVERAGVAIAKSLGLREAARTLGDRMLAQLPVEVPFDDGPGSNPRNNSSVITLLRLAGKRILLTADAGVPAIERALDYADTARLPATKPDVVQIPHHGSRRNGSSALLDRVLGEATGEERGASFVNVVSRQDPKHPSGRIVNAYKRRGYPYFWTAGTSYCWSEDAPVRAGWGPATPGPTLAEPDDDA
jgi:beta-lactamase superfamily II metal-dependent hydrolase